MSVAMRKLLPLARLKDAAHNPLNRAKPENVKALVASLDLVGLLHPVSVTSKNVIIDGHRRAAAARVLGWKDIECNVFGDDTDPDLVYASVNVTARRMSGNDALGVWLSNPKAVTEATANRMKLMVEHVGRPVAVRLYNAGMSHATYLIARRICRYCDDLTPEYVGAVLEWVLKFPVLGHVRKAMEAGADPRFLREAIRKGKPVKLSLEVA